MNDTLATPIVVGVDGSWSANRALMWAADEASRLQLPLLVMHSVDFPASSSSAGVDLDGSLVWSVQADGERLLRQARDKVRERYPDLPVELRLENLSPVAGLAQVSCGARMVVLGSSGKGALRGALVGSNAVGVLHRARCPVAVIRGEEPDSSVPGPVLVGVDGSAASDLAVKLAFDEAAWRGADVLAAHARTEHLAVSAGASACALPMDWDRAGEGEEQMLAEKIGFWQERYPAVKVRKVFSFARPKRWLLELAKGAQLVVVGTRGRGELASTFLGSTSQAMVYHSPCPLLIAREDRKVS
ncbi:UspA domain protein [Segniliparus rotundus DSM 44985]|uniref:UspA domain protein n=1 Tax=Segniliparus rotundus (strain ATCC BAA-972 / CDC 1076 / CIP 108378 / DSM 44985 / JCM 13578) TaxID=640132 RepID=D6ZCA4_SEGRD|nr:universal stress protein [Segniliparus rotundus]ADG99073.1 UspA domain protein [Segniliparus rotundus DSM 44985]